MSGGRTSKERIYPRVNNIAVSRRIWVFAKVTIYLLGSGIDMVYLNPN